MQIKNILNGRIGDTVTVQGWIMTCRKQKNLSFRILVLLVDLKQLRNLTRQQKNMMRSEDVTMKDLIAKKSQLKKLNILFRKMHLTLKVSVKKL